MIRAIAAVLVGYVVTAVLSVASAGLLWIILGAEGAFAGQTTVASVPWASGSCLLGLVAAIVGGLTAAAIGRHPTNLPVKVLAAVVIVFGLALAFAGMGAEPQPLPEGRTTADLTFVEAGQIASSPTWYLFTIPFVGAVGVLLGGRLKGTGKG